MNYAIKILEARLESDSAYLRRMLGQTGDIDKDGELHTKLAPSMVMERQLMKVKELKEALMVLNGVRETLETV